MTKQPSPKLTSDLTSDPSSGTNTRTHRWQAKSLAGIAALGLLLGGATACSDDGSKDKDSGVASNSEKATSSAAVNKDSNLNEAILPPEDGPQGGILQRGCDLQRAAGSAPRGRANVQPNGV